tara:strand:- start:531 stop:677 length:147 start_codon:yes stop_codon:yes gene_type:complete
MKKNKFRFKYKSINDSEYIKDKKELFKEHGNGWWLFVGKPLRRRKGYL